MRGGSPDTIYSGYSPPLCGRLIVVSDQAYHRCVVSEFDNDVGAVCGCTVMCVQGVQEWAKNAALRSTSVEGQRFSPRVWSFATSVAGTMVLNAEL